MARNGHRARHWRQIPPSRPTLGPGTPVDLRLDVLGVEISAINPEMALDIISGWVEADAREYVCVRDVHGVVKSLDDSELRRIHKSSGLVTPDGMPLVWAGRLAGADWMRRVYGPQLIWMSAPVRCSTDGPTSSTGLAPGSQTISPPGCRAIFQGSRSSEPTRHHIGS